MPKTSPRTPRVRYDKECEQCGKPFVSFRKTARFCSDNHAARAAARRRDDRRRKKVIEECEGRCVDCGTDKSRHWFVRFDPRRNKRVLLCGKHQSELSRYLFKKRVPEPGTGYARRVFQKKCIEEENKALGL